VGGEERELMTATHEALREALAALEPFALFPDDDGRPDEAMSGMRVSFGAIRAARRAYALIEAALDTQTGQVDCPAERGEWCPDPACNPKCKHHTQTGGGDE
jgi:hypothetical protein